MKKYKHNKGLIAVLVVIMMSAIISVFLATLSQQTIIDRESIFYTIQREQRNYKTISCQNMQKLKQIQDPHQDFLDYFNKCLINS